MPYSYKDYLPKILNSRVYDIASVTNLDAAHNLSNKLSNTILLKREDEQPIFSFKLRGAYNKMSHLSPALLKKGVICASAGNHGQGVALAAQNLGCRALVVMPTTTPIVKIDAVQALGAEVLLHGESYSEAYAHALEFEKRRGLKFVHPFDDPDVIAGQGTIAMEMLRQTRHLDAVFVAVGGGGLIAGVACYIKSVRPDIKIIGVQMNDSNAMAQSIAAGRRVTLKEVGLFSDGTAVKQVGVETFRLARELVDDWIEVDTDAVCAAIKDVFIDTRSIVEPAGAMGVAAIKKYVEKHKSKGLTYASILCGANMNFDRLRFVAERTGVGEEREALLAVTIPEKRGSFKRFCELINELPANPRNVTEFSYRVSNECHAHVFVGITTIGRGESMRICNFFEQHGFTTQDLTHDDLAQEHIRHMVGGHSALAHDERILHFVFPERPGALMKFLTLMQPSWNISLFHYRNQAADYGNILVGLQVPNEEKNKLEQFLKKLGYIYSDESNNPAINLFLGNSI